VLRRPVASVSWHAGVRQAGLVGTNGTVQLWYCVVPTIRQGPDKWPPPPSQRQPMRRRRTACTAILTRLAAFIGVARQDRTSKYEDRARVSNESWIGVGNKQKRMPESAKRPGDCGADDMPGRRIARPSRTCSRHFGARLRAVRDSIGNRVFRGRARAVHDLKWRGARIDRPRTSRAALRQGPMAAAQSYECFFFSRAVRYTCRTVRRAGYGVIDTSSAHRRVETTKRRSDRDVPSDAADAVTGDSSRRMTLRGTRR